MGIFRTGFRYAFVTGMNLRVIDKDGEPWFVATDVVIALGLTNTTVALKFVDEDDRAKQCIGPSGVLTNLVTESGLYSLILKSRKPEAKAFKKWVTSDVLPTIRKTGGYLTPAVAQLAYTDPDEFIARALLMAKQKIEGLEVIAKGLEPHDPAEKLILLKDWLKEVKQEHLTTPQRATPHSP